LGRAHDSAEALFEAERTPTRRTRNDRGDALLQLTERPMCPEEGLAHLLRQAMLELMGERADEVAEVVFTVPAQWSRAQRQGLSHAARLAGLKVTQLVAAPVAAALSVLQGHAQAQGTQEAAQNAEAEALLSAPQYLLVVDVGAGSWDVAVLAVTPAQVEVLQLRSVPWGGDRVDDILMQGVATDFHATHGMDLRAHPMAHERLRQATRRARERLSTEEETTLELPYIAADASGAKHVKVPLTGAAVLDAMMEGLADGISACQQALQGAEVETDRLEAIWLCGGMAQAPGLKDALEALGGPVQVLGHDAAAQGAAHLAAVYAQAVEGPTLTVSPEARAQAVPEGAKQGLTQAEVQALLEAQESLLAEASRAHALTALRARAQTLLANLAQSTQTATEISDDADNEPLDNLRGAMQAVEAALSDADSSEEGHLALMQHVQSLDIAAAQWQRGAAHA
jgi:molecular chaperone DnaK